MIILKLFLITWLVTASVMGLAFLWYRSNKNPSIVDMFWPLGILISVWLHTYLGGTNGIAVLFLALLFTWAIRLSVYLYLTRIRSGKTHDVKRGYLIQFQFQAFLQALLATSISGICYATLTSSFHSVGWFILGIFVTIFGIALETLADTQIYKFKRNSAHYGHVCKVGLWRFSRHPNLFFEWIVWIGFALMNTAGIWNGWALLAPVIVYITIRFVIIPLSEEVSLESRVDQYHEYQESTSMFFPTLPKE